MKVLVAFVVELTAHEREVLRRKGCVSHRDLKDELQRRAAAELGRDIDFLVRQDEERRGASA